MRSPAYRRFMASTNIDYERWHDGEPYDTAALADVKANERAEIEAWLLARADHDWRDIEGLLAIGTARAREAVIEQLRHGKLEQRLAAARRLPADPDLEADREAAIIAGLGAATVMNGLTTALDLAAEYRGGPIVDALFRAALRDDREMAVHAAALLLFLHGKAKEEFDWDRRELYLQFGAADLVVRVSAFRQLCAECGVDPEPYLAR